MPKRWAESSELPPSLEQSINRASHKSSNPRKLLVTTWPSQPGLRTTEIEVDEPRTPNFECPGHSPTSAVLQAKAAGCVDILTRLISQSGPPSPSWACIAITMFF
jgi:hypothetical protein